MDKTLGLDSIAQQRDGTVYSLIFKPIALICLDLLP